MELPLPKVHGGELSENWCPHVESEVTSRPAAFEERTVTQTFRALTRSQYSTAEVRRYTTSPEISGRDAVPSSVSAWLPEIPPCISETDHRVAFPAGF